MKIRYILPLLILSILFACGTGDEDGPTSPVDTKPPVEQNPTTQPEPDETTEPLQFGTVSGRVIDATTENPIPGVKVTLFDLEVETEVDGGFVFNDIPYEQEQVLTVSDPLYHEHSITFVIDQVRSVKNVDLKPLNDHEEELDAFLENMSTLLESLEADNLSSLQNLFSETYAAADDQVTNVGIISGVVPPNYEGVIPTFEHVFEQYSWLNFSFKQIEFDITHARKASIQMLMSVESEGAEDKQLRMLDGRCQFDFRREGNDWKIVYWQLLNLSIKL